MRFNLISSTILWIIIIGGITLVKREKIAGLINKIQLPKFWLFLLSGIFYSIIEENINCPPTGCSLIPITIIFFTIFLLILFGLIKLLKIKKSKTAILIFGLIGWIVEFFLGSYKAVLWSAPVVTILMSVWTFLTYAVIAIVPATILLGPTKLRK